MKKFRNIFLLSSLLLGIVFIWLIPKTKGEKKTQYVRIYTEEREVPEEIDSSQTEKRMEKGRTEKTEKKKVRKERVLIQKDILIGKVRLEDLKPSIYSRGMHFRPIDEITLSELFPDSNTAKLDSVVVAAE